VFLPLATAAKRGFFPIVCALISVLPARADEPVYLMQPLIVSATQIATPAEQIGSSVSVLTADDIERNQWRTLPDALRALPGVQVEQAGGPGSVAAVFIWGANANHTKIIVDGVDASDPSTPNGAFDFSQILLSDVARIEVLRGPQSGLYGSDAIGGVILIETKKGEGEAHVTGSLEGGSFGTFNQNAAVSGSDRGLNYAFNVGHFRSTETPVTPLDLLPPGQIRNDDLYDNLTLSSRLGLDLSDQFGLGFVVRYTRSSLDFTGPDDLHFTMPAAEPSNQIDQQLYTRGEARWTLFDGAFENRFGLAYTDDWTRQFDGTAFEIHESPLSYDIGHRVKGDWRGKYTIAPEETLLFGAEAELDQIVASPITAQNGNQAGFVEWQGKIVDRLYGSASLRYDHNDAFGSAVTWHVAPIYTIDATGTQLKASAGTGFKAPTLNQLFVSYPAFNFTANPDLQPERSLGYDFGFEQPVANNRFRFGATYFHNDISDLIDYNETFTTLINIGRATIDGGESFASFAVTPQIDLRADYTYTVARDDQTGQELLRRPRNKASLTGSWRPLDKLTLAASVIYVGSRLDVNYAGTADVRAPPYTLVNLDASYQLTATVAVFARVENLLNEHYEDVVGFLRPGLGVFGGVRVAFDAKAMSP
jgi:vitamin B12 transporter